ncbi:MAG: fibronectin type III domain-containing protein [Fimbriimonas sp.]
MIGTLIGLSLLLPRDPNATYHGSDASPALDPLRPVTRVARDSFTLQYFTRTPAATIVEVREGEIPQAAYTGGPKPDRWGKVRIVTNPAGEIVGTPRILTTLAEGRVFLGPSGKRTLHHVTVTGLRPGRRYFYRIYDPGANPTDAERRWGASKPWRREFAVSTQAATGSKTILHLPVKVILMPNVVNVESAYADPANPAPMPPKMSEAEIAKLRAEYATSARVLWMASGMRLWVDYQIQVDDRWQRWGPEPPAASGPYRGLPASRSYSGRDFDAPGGGAFTIFDPRNPTKANRDPIVEARPFSSQVEQAFPRRWNPSARRWDFYTSGGGTFGIDSFPEGTPARSQYLGGGDTAWLATHEFHHQMESLGAFSLGNREDDRIVFDHPAPRRRTVKSDGSADETTWTTNGRHGEHWDVIAFWDRQLSDAQWLRMFFGYTTTAKDADGDGFPDSDPRLPLDERRFGSSSLKPATDGALGDLAKAMQSNWAPGPLQATWTKPPNQAVRPHPTKSDTDGDGIADRDDAYPLYPWAPLIMPQHATIDGDMREWASVAPSAAFDKGGIRFTFKQTHDDAGYYGYYEVHGPWRRIEGTFDGEGKGVYSGEGVLGFHATQEPDGRISTRPTFGGAPGLSLRSTSLPNGGTAIEFRLPNRGEGPWFWERGGREIGVSLNVWDESGRGYSAYEPYRLFYARMVEAYGEVPMPTNPPPAPAEGGAGVTVYRPGASAVQAQGGWRVDDGAWRHSGDESALVISGLQAKDFDLFAIVEAKADAILGAFTPGIAMNAGQGYIGFVGGYSNTVTRMRVFGQEKGDASVVMTPGRHTIQMSRRAGELWLLVDGKPVIYTTDPNPKAIVDRLAVLGGYGGAQVVHEIRIR